MKIAFIVPEFPSLSQTFVLNQITGMKDRGHHVDIFAGRANNHQKAHGDIFKYKLLQNTHILPRLPEDKSIRSLRGLRFVIEFFAKNPKVTLKSFNFAKFGMRAFLQLLIKCKPFLPKRRYDIIHCHFGQWGRLAAMLREIGVIEGRLTTVFHGYDLTSYLRQSGANCYSHLFERGDLFLPISNRWREKLIQIGCPESKIEVHRMGIDIEKFNFRNSKNKKKNGIDILTIGRLVEKKGIRYGIEAIAKIKNKIPGVQYHIAGDGPLRAELTALVANLALSENIKLLGWINQDQVSCLMDKVDILMMPSVTSKKNDQEGIPVVIMEAMAKGMPVLGTYHSGIPEIVIDKVSGLLVRERDSDALADKLLYLIKKPEERKIMGINGRQIVKRNYEINVLNDQLVNIFHRLIDQAAFK